MGSKSQRKKERHAQRRKEKRKQQTQSQPRQNDLDRLLVSSLGSNVHHRQRLAQQVPSAWPGEQAEDVAIFEDAALSSLPPELAAQATAVREALGDALELRGDDALKRVATIPRGSPLSEWRLFIRGLVDWLDNQLEVASETWARLNVERRPGRIATSMMVALRSDLDHASPDAEQSESAPSGEQPQKGGWHHFDAQQLYHAKLLRRVRFDRAALRTAEAGVKIPEEAPELLLGPRKTEWLRRFIAEYGDTEPDLAAALAQTGLGRAFRQNFSNLFDDAVRVLPGPRHDRRNRLLTFFYYAQTEDNSQKGEHALKEYLDRDLPQNVALPEEVRGAIASRIHFNKAILLMHPEGGGSFLDYVFGPPENTKEIRKHFLASQKAYPAHRNAYVKHVEWVQSKLDDDRLIGSEETRLETELTELMRRWSTALPNDVEPRLWLVDDLLENELMEEARPHVEFLAASRQDDPRVRAIPWKWQLLEAMRLCRRKVWLDDVPARLNEAEQLWPAWLPKQWLPYLRAAWGLRTGKKEAFAEERKRICQESGLIQDSLTDACLMLAAAQRMRVAAADLKPLRAAVDRSVAKIKSLPMEELLETGSFFWDLHRAQLLYPAYRLHGKNIGKEMVARLEKTPKLLLDGIDNERLQKAVLWGSECRFWLTSYNSRQWAPLSQSAIERHPVFMAAKVNAFLKERYPWNADGYRQLAAPLREAAASQRDAYLRRWFIQLADQLDDILAGEESRFLGFPFGGPAYDESGDDDSDEDDFDLDYDPDCNCNDCRIARRRAAERASTSDDSPF